MFLKRQKACQSANWGITKQVKDEVGESTIRDIASNVIIEIYYPESYRAFDVLSSLSVPIRKTFE